MWIGRAIGRVGSGPLLTRSWTRRRAHRGCWSEGLRPQASAARFNCPEMSGLADLPYTRHLDFRYLVQPESRSTMEVTSISRHSPAWVTRARSPSRTLYGHRDRHESCSTVPIMKLEFRSCFGITHNARPGMIHGRTAIHALVVGASLGIVACSDDSVTSSPEVPNEHQGSGGSAGSDGTGASSDPEARYFAPNRVLEVAIDIAADDWEALRVEKRSLQDIILGEDCQDEPFVSPFTWKRATVTIDGVRLTSVGLRKKGFLGSLDEQRPSLKIATDQFVSQDLGGVRDWTFNNVRQDPAIISECLGFSYFSRVGLAAPRCNFAHVVVNGSDLGVYAHLEPIKKPFLGRHFASDSGALYEGTLSDFRAGWLDTFEPKTKETDPTRAPLAEIANTIAGSDDQLVPRLRKVLDLDRFLLFWATETVIGHMDGYSRNTNNFYAYHDPGSGLTTLIPWGADLLFGNGESSANVDDPLGAYTVGAIAHALYSNPEGRQLMLDQLTSLLESSWSESEFMTEAKRMATLVRPFVDSTRVTEFDAAQANVLEFIANRCATLQEALATAPSKPQPLRDSVCLRPIGKVSGSFTTSWGTESAPDPFTSGTGVLDVSVNGVTWQYVSGYVGAVAGLNPDSTATQDSELAIPGLRSDGTISLVVFGFDHERAVPGILELDLDEVPGLLFELNPNVAGSEKVIGVVTGGTLTFERVAAQPGAKVAGSFSGQLYSTPLLGGF